MLARVQSATLLGVEALKVDVEVDASTGMPCYHLVGLPTGACREGRDRIAGALENSGCKLPQRRVTVNLAPADLRKDSSAFDLPLAVGLAVAHEMAPAGRLGRYLFLGELGLDGAVRPVRGVLPAARMAARDGFRGVVVPTANAGEAALAGIEALGAGHLGEVLAFLRGAELHAGVAPPPGSDSAVEDLADVRGQEHARAALEVAAAGGHNLLFVGPPGCGKTLLARRLPGLLPPLDDDEAIEVSAVHSAAGLLSRGLVRRRPFRAPHHTISDVGLLGGGTPPRPGELSLAHGGVLFLDELPEFRRSALESLRQPLEAGSIQVTRATYTVTLPARTLVVAAMNPCPCGHHGASARTCTCTPGMIERYRGRVSGPLLDRIDLQLRVQPVSFADLTRAPAEPTAAVRERILAARAAQAARLAPIGLRTNAAVPAHALERMCPLPADGRRFVERAVALLGLSARGVARVQRVARTLADLDGDGGVRSEHVKRALALRDFDRPL